MENKENSNLNIESNQIVDIKEDNETTTESNSSAKSESIDYSTLIDDVNNISSKLDTLTSISIVSMVGLGVIVGIISALIFSQYFRS